MTPAQEQAVATKFARILDVSVERDPKNIYGLHGDVVRVTYAGVGAETHEVLIDQRGLTYPPSERLRKRRTFEGPVHP